MSCDLCARYEGDVFYKQQDVSYAARKLRGRDVALADVQRAKDAKAALAEVKRHYAEHLALEHSADTA